MFFIYVLLSKSTGKLYIGQTENLQRRIQEHKNGLARYTRGRGPWELILSEEYETRSEAMKKEKFLKSGLGREWLRESLINRAGQPQAD